jgi:hypothetical protein
MTITLTDTQAAWLKDMLHSIADKAVENAMASGSKTHLAHRRSAQEIIKLLPKDSVPDCGNYGLDHLVGEITD